MADIKINGTTFNGVNKLTAQKADNTGTQDFVLSTLQSKSVTLGASAPTTPIVPDASYGGLSSVSVALDNSVIKADNIKKDVQMLGVTGSYEGAAPTQYSSFRCETGGFNRGATAMVSWNGGGWQEVDDDNPYIDETPFSTANFPTIAIRTETDPISAVEIEASNGGIIMVISAM